MRWIISAIIGLSFIAAINLWNHPAPASSSQSAPSDRLSAYDKMSRKEFKWRLKYHGLHRQISVVICDEKKCWYRNAAGEKCTF